MELTREEEEMLKGKYGEASAKALEAIIAVGESVGAPRLIPIKHAHISGVSYGTIGEPGALFLEKLASMGARFRVPATVNPIGYDPEVPDGYGYLRITRDFVEGQSRILKALRKMGAELELTCTPYYVDTFEKYDLRVGDSVAWGESSAVAYANTVLGLKTNREGGPLALLAAIAGRIYLYGLHDDANRMPQVSYDISKFPRVDEAVLGVLAEFLAEVHEDDFPPMIEGVANPPDYYIREFAAAIGAVGSLAMAVIPGVTPLPAKPSTRRKLDVPWDVIRRSLSDKEPTSKPDVIFIGCPHASYAELTIIDRYLRKEADIPILVTLSRSVYQKAKNTGLAASLERKGVKFLRSTCLIVSRSKPLKVATNSMKAYFYLSKKMPEVSLAPLTDLLRMASR